MAFNCYSEMEKWIENRWLIVFIRVKVIPCIECGRFSTTTTITPFISVHVFVYVLLLLPVCLGFFLIFYFNQNCCLTVLITSRTQTLMTAILRIFVCEYVHCSWHLPFMMDMGKLEKPTKADFPYRFGNRRTMSVHNDLVVILCLFASQ